MRSSGWATLAGARVGGSAPASCFSSLDSTFLGAAAAGAGLSSSDAFLLLFSLSSPASIFRFLSASAASFFASTSFFFS